MNRNQRRSHERLNLKGQKSKVIHLDHKKKKLSEIKQKSFNRSILFSIFIGILIATFFIMTSCSSGKEICDAYH